MKMTMNPITLSTNSGCYTNRSTKSKPFFSLSSKFSGTH